MSKSLTFRHVDALLSDKDISVIERDAGVSLPLPLRKHYLAFNGGAPDRYVYEDSNVDTVISECLPLRSERGRGTSVDAYRSLVLKKKIVPRHLFPFAVDGGGDYFFVDCKTDNAEVYLFRSDTTDPNDRLLALKVGLEGFWARLKSE